MKCAKCGATPPDQPSLGCILDDVQVPNWLARVQRALARAAGTFRTEQGQTLCTECLVEELREKCQRLEEENRKLKRPQWYFSPGEEEGFDSPHDQASQYEPGDEFELVGTREVGTFRFRAVLVDADPPHKEAQLIEVKPSPRPDADFAGDLDDLREACAAALSVLTEFDRQIVHVHRRGGAPEASWRKALRQLRAALGEAPAPSAEGSQAL